MRMFGKFKVVTVTQILLCLLTLFPLLRLGVPSSMKIVLQPPVNTVGYVGHRATFNCTLPGTFYRLTWFITEQYQTPSQDPPYKAAVHFLPAPLVDPPNITSVLSIQASSETNNTIVFCRAYRHGTINIYSNATLLVQDRLGPPQNLKANITDSGVHLSFVQPYSLPGSEISYYVCIIDVGSLSTELRVNLVDTYFNFVFSDFNVTKRCEDQYIEFSVAAYNPAGMGNYSMSIVIIRGDQSACVIPSDFFLTLALSTGFVLILILIISALLLIVMCALMVFKRPKQSCNSSHDTNKSDPEHLSQNDAYGISTMQENVAYITHTENEPRIYEVVDDDVRPSVKDKNCFDYQDA